MHTRRSTLLYPKFRAESPSPGPPASLALACPQFTPPAPALDRQRHGPQQACLTRPVRARSGAARRAWARRGRRALWCPGRVSFGGPRGQASCPSLPLPASGPEPAARDRRAEPCGVSPVSARRSTELRAAEGLRRSRPGRRLALPGSRPLPGPPAAAAGAHVPAHAALGCTASAAGGLRDGWDRARREPRGS